MKGPDIFNDDEAYRKYLEVKEQSEKSKKERIDHILDEYCYQQLNLPASEYRSQQTDLIYKPTQYPINVIHPQRDHYTSQFIGFNQNSTQQRRRPQYKPQQQLNYPQYPQQHQQQIIQQQYMPQISMQGNPFINGAQSQLSQMPSLNLPFGNLAYNQNDIGQPMMPQYQYPKNTQKEDFLRNCDRLQNKMDFALRNQSSLY